MRLWHDEVQLQRTQFNDPYSPGEVVIVAVLWLGGAFCITGRQHGVHALLSYASMCACVFVPTRLTRHGKIAAGTRHCCSRASKTAHVTRYWVSHAVQQSRKTLLERHKPSALLPKYV